MVVGTFVGGDGTNPLVITFNASADGTAVQAVAQQVAYRTDIDDPSTLQRTLEMDITDGDGGTSATAVRAMNVIAHNDAPVTSVTADSPTFTENGTAVGLFSSASIDLIEAADLVDHFVLTVDNLANGNHEKLNIDGTVIELTDLNSQVTSGNAYDVDVSVAGSVATVTISKTGGFSGTAAESLLDTISYENTSEAILNGTRNVTFVSLTDDGGASDTDANGTTSTVTVNGANDDPTNAGSLPTDVTVTEDVSGNVDLSALDISDLDHLGGSLTVRLTTSPAANLTATASTGITIGGNGTNQITLTGIQSDLNTYLDTASNIQYLHATQHTFGDNADTIQVEVSDNGNTGPGGGGYIDFGTANVDITAVNDAPLLDTNNGAATTIGGTVTISTGVLNTTDVDDAPTELTYTVTGTAHGQVELASNPGVAVGSFTQAQVDAGDVVFVHDGLTGANGSVDFTVADGGEDGATTTNGTFNVSIGGATSDNYATNEDTAINVDAGSGLLANDGAGGSLVAGNVVVGFDAAADTDGDGTWSSNIGSVNLTAGTGVTYTTSPDSPPAGITAAFDLDGSGGLTSASLDSFVEIDATQSATLETWLKFDAIGGNQIIFDTGDSTNGITLLNTGSELRLEYRAPGASGFASVSGALNPGTWHHIALTIDLSVPPELQVWLDGNLELSRQAMNLTNWSDSGFGLGTTNGTAAAGFTGNLAGQIAHFRVHDRVLDGADISNNHANPGGGSATPFVASFDDSGTLGNVTVNADGSFSYDPNGQFDHLKPGQNAVDSFDYTYDDGLGNQDIVTVTLTINGVNDGVSVATNTGVTVGEGASVTITTGMLDEGDVDDDGAELTYTVTGGLVGGQLELTTGPGVAISSFTQDDIDSGRLVYVHDGVTTGNDSFDFSLADGGEDGSTAVVGTFNITVNNVNDAPTYVGLDGNPTYTENGVAVLFDVDATIVDEELSAFDDFGGSTLTLSRNGGANVEDVFLANGNLVFNAGILELSTVPIGTVTNASGQLTLTFTAGVSNAQVNEVLQSIAYSNASDDPPANVQIDWTFDDGNSGAQGSGGAQSVTGTTTVDIIAVNDAPVLNTGFDLRLPNVTEDATNPAGTTVAAMLASDGGSNPLTDVDSGAVEGIAVTGVDDTNGTWSYSTDGGTNWYSFAASGVSTAGANDGAAVLLDDASMVRFVPDPDYHGTAGELTFRGWDQTAGADGDIGVDVSVNGGTTAFSMATETVTLDVLSVNDDPVLTTVGRSGNAYRSGLAVGHIDRQRGNTDRRGWSRFRWWSVDRQYHRRWKRRVIV